MMLSTSPSRRAGFSMIELIAVITIIGMVSVVGVSVLLTSQVRGTRATSVSRVRQQGQYTLSTLSFLLRNAQYLTVNQTGATCSPGMIALSWRNPDDGIQEVYLHNGQLASNSGTVITDPPAGYLTTTGVTLSDVSFDCQQVDTANGALITFHFTVTAGTVTGANESYYAQTFSGSAYVRSRP
jgi:prepilin-type N-terminal cleavage/methylation domain-containing protein